MSAGRLLRATVSVLAVLALLGAGAGSASGEGLVEGVLSRVSATVDRAAGGALATHTAPAGASREGPESSPERAAGDAPAEGQREPPAETAVAGDATPAATGASSPREARSHTKDSAASGAAGHPLRRLVSNVTSAIPGAGRAPAVGRVLHDVATPALKAVKALPVPTPPSGGTLPALGARLLGAAGGLAEGLIPGAAADRAGGVLGTPLGGSWEPARGPVGAFAPGSAAIASLPGGDAGVAGLPSALSSQGPPAALGVVVQAGAGEASAPAGRQRAGVGGVARGEGADLARAGGGGGASRSSKLIDRSPLAPVAPPSGAAPALAGGAAAGLAGIAIALMALVATRPPGLLRRLLPGVPLGPSEPFALLLSRPG